MHPRGIMLEMPIQFLDPIFFFWFLLSLSAYFIPANFLLFSRDAGMSPEMEKDEMAATAGAPTRFVKIGLS